MLSRTIIGLALGSVVTLGAASAQAQLDCAALIAGDSQRPASGQFGYTRVGTGRDERCEGRIMVPNSGGFTIEKYMVEVDWTGLRSADKIQVRARGLPEGQRGQVTLLGSGSSGSYRLDIFTRGTEASDWPAGSIAKRLELNWPGLQVVGRTAREAGTPQVFFPVDLRRADDSTSEGALMLYLRYDSRSPRIKARIGEYDQPGKCRTDALLQEWAPYAPTEKMKISLPQSTGSRFCIAFEVRSENDKTTGDPIAVYFVR